MRSGRCEKQLASLACNSEPRETDAAVVTRIAPLDCGRSSAHAQARSQAGLRSPRARNRQAAVLWRGPASAWALSTRRAGPAQEQPRRELVWGLSCQALILFISCLFAVIVGSGQRRRSEGSPPLARGIAPRTCIRWIQADPNHDAVMRIGGEAPGRRAQSRTRRQSRNSQRVATTSDRYRQPVAVRDGAEPILLLLRRGCLDRRPQNEASRHLSGCGEPPQGDE
jgi:hypothetical protein